MGSCIDRLYLVFFGALVCVFFISFAVLDVQAFDSTEAWSVTTNLPYFLASHASFSMNNKLFVVEGSAITGQSHDQIISAMMNSDGSISQWIIESQNTPTSLIYHSVAIKNPYIYVLGGKEENPGSSNGIVDRVFLGKMDFNGNIGSWSQSTSLPIRSGVGAALEYNNRIYYAGGFDESVWHDEIFYADINEDGTLGRWVLAGRLPEANVGFGMIENNGHLVVISGYSQSSGFNTKSFVTTINLNGTIGSWVETSQLPEGVNRAGVVVVGSTVYLIGGGSDNGNLDKVYYAGLNLDGSLGAWSLSNNRLPQGVCCGSATVVNDYIYLMGGYGRDYLDTVYFTKIGLQGTPTPTPTPFLTATPTPTPLVESPVKKIVFVPGMEASWNPDAILNCKASGYVGDWTLAPYAASVYQPLIDSLSSVGWDVKPYYYDWRKEISENGGGFQTFVDSIGERVNAVGHSMGGLLTRAYLENTKEENKFEKMMTVGAPHQGSPIAYPAWAAGQIWNDDLLQKIAVTLLIKRCGGWPDHDRQTLRQIVPSVRDLLPTFDYLVDKNTGLFKTYSSQAVRNEWLPTEFVSPFFGVNVGTLSGTGKKTISAIETRRRTALDILRGDWEDGRPEGKITTTLGDNSVLVSSSQLLEADNRVINQTHLGIVASNTGVNQILNFFGSPPVEVLNFVEPTSALIVVTADGDLELEREGKIQKGDKGMLVVYGPKRGIYNLKIKPNKLKSWVGVVYFKADGSVFWKEFNYGEKKTKIERVDWED